MTHLKDLRFLKITEVTKDAEYSERLNQYGIVLVSM